MMDYYFILLLGVAAFLSLKGEKNLKRKKLFIGIYVVLIGLAFLYLSGESIGHYIYNITHP
jgi:glycerol uptake facilitator-like aquaporin